MRLEKPQSIPRSTHLHKSVLYQNNTSDIAQDTSIVTSTTTASPYLPMTPNSTGDYENEPEYGGSTNEEEEYNEEYENQNNDNYHNNNYMSDGGLARTRNHRRRIRSW